MTRTSQAGRWTPHLLLSLAAKEVVVSSNGNFGWMDEEPRFVWKNNAQSY